MAGKDGITLLYAEDIDTGEIQHISKVARGKACRCKCPGCGWPVEAVHRKERISSFRHKAESNGQERECTNREGALETIVHIVTKSIIAELQSIYLPAYKSPARQYRGETIYPIEIVDSREWQLSNPKIEDYSLSSRYVPDVTFDSPRGKLAIEVLQSHAVEKEKLDKMKEDGLYVLELNVAHLKPEDLGKEPIRQLLHKTAYAKWLNFPLEESDIVRLQQWEESERKRVDAWVEQQEAQRIARERHEEEKRRREIQEELETERLERIKALEKLRELIEKELSRKAFNLLEEMSASPIDKPEKVIIYRKIQELCVELDRYLPEDQEQLGFGRPSTKELITDSVRKRLSLARRDIAEKAATLFMDFFGRNALDEIFCMNGWNGERIDFLHDGSRWKKTYECEIEVDLPDFLYENLEKLGVQYYEPRTRVRHYT